MFTAEGLLLFASFVKKQKEEEKNLKMLLARKISLKQLKNAVILQQNKIISIAQTPKTLCTTSFLTKQSENHTTTQSPIRVYYGKINFIN